MCSSPANSLNFACKLFYLPDMLETLLYVCATRLSYGTANHFNSSAIWFGSCSVVVDNACVQKSKCPLMLPCLLTTDTHKLNCSCFETPGVVSAIKAHATLLFISNVISLFIISMSLFQVSLLINVSFEPHPK